MDPKRASVAGRPYFWGTDPHDVKMLPVVFGWSVALVTFWLYSSGAGAGKPALAGYSNLENYGTAVLVLVAHAFLQQLICNLEQFVRNMINLDFGNFSLGEYTLAEKMSGNHMEQGLPFVISFLCYTLFVNRAVGVELGVLYVLLRAAYPVLFAFYGRATTLVQFAGQPMNGILFLFQLSTVLKIMRDYDLVGETSEGVMLPFVVLFACAMNIFVNASYGAMIGPLVKRGVNFNANANTGAMSDEAPVTTKQAAAPAAAPVTKMMTPEEQARLLREQQARDGFTGRQIAGRRL
ncbi:unnamed protein product [Amoebophrya sp. A120]|nr:unnamed protein product [Amoebophrya sp. A120]|eukprot:GSA120T00002395001.1